MVGAFLLVYHSIVTRIIWSAPTSDVDRLAIAVEYSFVRVLCGELSINTRGHFFPWQGPPNYALVLLCELEMFWFSKQKTSLKKDCLLFKVGKCFWRHIAIGTSPRQCLIVDDIDVLIYSLKEIISPTCPMPDLPWRPLRLRSWGASPDSWLDAINFHKYKYENKYKYIYKFIY